jgi:hypothetical protein
MSAFNASDENTDNLASNSLAPPTIELSLSRFEKPIEVDLEQFFEFSFDLAEDLLDLEFQFKPRRRVSSSRTTLERSATR